MMKEIILFFTIMGSQAWAASTEHGAGHGAGHAAAEIPYSTIGYQAINLGILLIVIFFAVRKSVAALFKTRYADYNEQARKTEEASKAAELALAEIKNRIQNLKNTEMASLETAKLEASQLKNKIIQEAREQAEKIKTDTQLVMAAEISNAKNEIRKEIINTAIELAKTSMKASSQAISKNSEKVFLQDISRSKNQEIA